MLKKLKFSVSVKILTIIFSLIFSQAYSQNMFEITVGGSAREVIWGPGFHTSDGGYIIAGNQEPSPVDWYIIKISSTGILQWTSTFGGTNDDQARAVVQTSDGKFVAAGWTNSYSVGGNRNILIVKLDTNGTLLWSKSIGEANSNEEALSITPTSDGGFAISGFVTISGNSDLYIAKFDNNGTLLWNKLVGGSGTEWSWDIMQTSDGGFAAAGFTTSFGSGNADFYVLKLDSAGSFQWSRTIGGAGYDYALSIIQALDGGYVLTGFTSSFGAGGYDFYIVKISSTGSLLWTRTAGNTSDNRDFVSVIIPNEGGYAVSGKTFTSPSYNGCIIKLDTGGTVQWSKATLFSGYIISTNDGGYALTGTTDQYGSGLTDFCIDKLDANWNTCSSNVTPSLIYSSGGTLTITSPIIISPVLNVTSPTPTFSTYGTRTVVCTVTGIQPGSNEILSSYSLSQNYPNPFNPVTKIKFDIKANTVGQTFLSVYDIQGKEIASLVNEKLKPGTYEVTFDGSNLPSGIYFYKLSAGDFKETKKMVLIK